MLVFLYAPLLLVVVNAFNASRSFAFPPTGFTAAVVGRRRGTATACGRSLANSAVVGLGATAIALVLGTMAAFAVQRYDFFGKHVVSFLVVLPITLPGIVTGIALNATFTSALGVTLGLATVIIGHATFCIVIVFNNTQARLRRLGTDLEDASADLGASPWQTFRYVTFPMMRGALVAGAILAFALSFDEIVVTTFTAGPAVQTLPIWIFGNLFRPNQAPVINVVAAALTVVGDHPGVAGPALRRRPGHDPGVDSARPTRVRVRSAGPACSDRARTGRRAAIRHDPAPQIAVVLRDPAQLARCSGLGT